MWKSMMAIDLLAMHTACALRDVAAEKRELGRENATRSYLIRSTQPSVGECVGAMSR